MSLPEDLNVCFYSKSLFCLLSLIVRDVLFGIGVSVFPQKIDLDSYFTCSQKVRGFPILRKTLALPLLTFLIVMPAEIESFSTLQSCF